jgi:hypothetical protein
MIEPLDIDDAFEEFMRKVNPSIPQHSPQYRESRRVWFAGVASLNHHLIALTSESEDFGARELQSISRQLLEFNHRVAEGRD